MHLWLVDAFTDTPFAGNPAGVCLLDEEKPDAWMQSVAREINQAETAFLLKREDGFGLRSVHPDRRGGSLRPRNTRERALPLERQETQSKGDRDLSHQERYPVCPSGRWLDSP